MKIGKFIHLSIITLICILGFNQLNASCVFSKAIEAQELEIGNMLSWNTSEELNNEFFVIEKSVDGIEFSMIGQVRGAGNSLEEQHYRYLDISTGESKIFYRLKQIDFDGVSSQSHTVIINRTTPNNFVVSSMSSTVTDKLFTLSLRSEIQDNLEYSVKSMKDEVLKSGVAEIVKGVNVVSIDLEDVKNGRLRFVLKVDDEEEELLIQKVDSSKVPNVNYVIKE